jgi:hypothetical protein
MDINRINLACANGKVGLSHEMVCEWAMSHGEVETDNEGQLIIYTGLWVMPDNSLTDIAPDDRS